MVQGFKDAVDYQKSARMHNPCTGGIGGQIEERKSERERERATQGSAYVTGHDIEFRRVGWGVMVQHGSSK